MIPSTSQRPAVAGGKLCSRGAVGAAPGSSDIVQGHVCNRLIEFLGLILFGLIVYSSVEDNET